MAQTVIPNGVQAIEFRNRVVDNFMADTKGSIFVGTGALNTNCSNSYIVETVAPCASTISTIQANTVQLPIYTGSGNTGIVFAQSKYLSVAVADNASQAAQAAKLGGGGYADKGDSTHPVYFSGGLPVAITKVASAAAADTAGSATHATNASKLDGGQKGSATQPIYINAAGQPCVCTSYASANVNSANYANQANVAGEADILTPDSITPSFSPGSSGSATISSSFTGQLLLRFRLEDQASGGTDVVFGTTLIYNFSDSRESRIIYEFPLSNLSDNSSTFSIKFKLKNNTLSWQTVSLSQYSYRLTYLQVIKITGVLS